MKHHGIKKDWASTDREGEGKTGEPKGNGDQVLKTFSLESNAVNLEEDGYGLISRKTQPVMLVQSAKHTQNVSFSLSVTFTLHFFRL